MFTFRVQYKNGQFDDFKSIETVKYLDILGVDVVISSDEILTANFPIGPNYHLFGPTRNYSVLGDDVRSISVIKE